MIANINNAALQLMFPFFRIASYLTLSRVSKDQLNLLEQEVPYENKTATPGHG